MAEQRVEDQYDVDLTAESGEYETAQEIDTVDLFEYVGDEDSPISQLKSLVLSIDWEITDDILEQFINELSNLKTIWADDKVKQVYIQGLDKIAKYIYKEKANANPNAIKLLLTFYHDLEKIVTSESMDYDEKKRILLEDVKKFEVLKGQIFHNGKQQAEEETMSSDRAEGKQQEPVIETDEIVETVDLVETDPDEEQIVESTVVLGDKEILRGLKAAILGIDWEITDQEMNQLAEEVHKLEESYRNSKAKLIFLQGIGALGAYINLKRPNAHAGAFTLLRSFFDGMEQVVVGGLSGEEEKKILLAEAEKFNEFKKIIAETIPKSADKIQAEQEAIRQDEPFDREDTDSEPAPALSETSEDLDDYSYSNETDEHVDDLPSGIESFFGSEDGDESFTESEVYGADIEDQNDHLMAEIDEKLQDFFDAETERGRTLSVDSQTALQGVHVESPDDDDSDEEPLPMDENGLAPALSSFDEEQVDEDMDIIMQPDKKEDHQEANELTLERLIEGEDSDYNVDEALKGVDVETEADDESDEQPLPMVDGELVPALPGHDGKSGFSEADIISTQEGASAGEDIKTRLDEFFADDKLAGGSSEGAYPQVPGDTDETIEDDESLETTKEQLDDFFADSTDDDFEMDLEPVGEEVDLNEEDVKQPSSGELFMEEATLIREQVDEAVEEAEEEEVSPEEDERVAFDAVPDVWDADDGPVIFLPVDDEDVSDLSFKGFGGDNSDQDDDFLFFDDIEEEPEGFDDIDFSVPGQEANDNLSSDPLAQESGTANNFDRFFDQEVSSEASDIQAPAAMSDELPARYSRVSGLSLENLQDCITTVGIEMTSRTMRDLLTEVGRLSQQLRDNPVERGLLNLLTTAVQQVQQGGRTIRSSGYSLIRSIVDKLEYVVQSSLTVEQAQECLLSETSKVLLWQQTILDIRTQGIREQAVPVPDDFAVNVDDDSEDDEDESFFFENDMAEEDDDRKILVDDA